MKRMFLLILAMFVPLAAASVYEKKLRKEVSLFSGKHHGACAFVPGRHEVVKSGISYNVPLGYLHCDFDSGIVVLFEGIVEEEDRQMVYSIGDISIIKRTR